MSPVVSFVMALIVSKLQIMFISEQTGRSGIGGVVDHTTRMGKERKIAMEMAIEDSMINNFASSSTKTCSQIHLDLQLHLKDSHGNPARAAATGNNPTTDKISLAVARLSTRTCLKFFSVYGKKNRSKKKET
ncbi:LOW QUALITY PROTEIN: hypothetical protein TorRG33x02_099340 [Trema orientale]|uniref:Uncharacterized protein n=1 Tax=Trema orientale TaxID=63057 RepID=A0A2P5F8V0_TREOI|nr:LOW QUALITY PROTEIN: hypothetical protein TorRG33x02_099340 [Trema orientale]